MTVAKLTVEGGKTYEKDKRTVVGRLDCSIDEYSNGQCAG
jgi:hypothetical protein